MGTRGHEAEVWHEIAAKGEDIGHNVVISYTSTNGTDKAGLLLYHPHADGSVCGGAVTFALPYGAPNVPRSEGQSPLWRVDSLEPLTLHPSIEDKTCSERLHGHIVNGRWVPC